MLEDARGLHIVVGVVGVVGVTYGLRVAVEFNILRMSILEMNDYNNIISTNASYIVNKIRATLVSLEFRHTIRAKYVRFVNT